MRDNKLPIICWSHQNLSGSEGFGLTCLKLSVAPLLNIKTSDSKTFKVDLVVAQQSQTFRTLLDDLGIDENSPGENTIPFFNGPIFKKALVWMEKN